MTKAHKSVLDGVVETVVPGSSLTVSNTDPKNPVVNAKIANQATAEAGLDNVQLMTALGVAQSIAKNSPPTDTSALALALADLQGYRLLMNGGVADAFDDTSGIYLGESGGIDSFTSLLLHLDGNLNDSSSNGLVQNLVSGGVSYATDQTRFGSGSLRYTSAANSYVLYNNEPGFVFGTGDFAIDMQIRPSVATYPMVLFDGRASAGGTSTAVSFYIHATGRLAFFTNGQERIVGTTSIAANVWHHIAITRVSGVTRLFLNGVQEGPDYIDANNYINGGPSRPVIGADLQGLNQFIGWLDELRVSKGNGRWSSNFTPPTQAYSLYVNGTNGIHNPSLGLYTPPIILGSDQTATHTTFVQAGNTVSVSSELAPFYGWQAFDKVVGGASGLGNWITANGQVTGWIRYQFASAKFIGSYSIRSGNGFANRTPRDWTLQASNTGAFAGEQVILDTRAGQTWNNGENKLFSIANPGSYLYYRVVVSAIVGGGDAYVQIDEIAFFLVTYENMQIYSVNYPSTSVPTQGRLVLQLNTPISDLVAGTDFQGEISRDGRANWTNVPLILTSTLGNIRTYESANSIDFSGPSGSSLSFRIRTLTNKNIPVSGVVMQWR